MIGVFCFISASFSQNNTLTSQDIKATCHVLAKLTDIAITKDRKDLVAIYYNTYEAIKSEQNISDDCANYFNQIKSKYSSSISSYNINIYEFPPKLTSSSVLGGFTHIDIDLLSKLKEMKISDEDIEQLLFLKELKENNVDVNFLKNSNPENLKIINQKLNKLDLNKLNMDRLNSLTKDNYEIKEFNQSIK